MPVLRTYVGYSNDCPLILVTPPNLSLRITLDHCPSWGDPSGHVTFVRPILLAHACVPADSVKHHH
jgi:hypothetical protein